MRVAVGMVFHDEFVEAAFGVGCAAVLVEDLVGRWWLCGV